METTNMIELDYINKSYGTNEAKNQVINNISLQIKRKTISVILGSSGSGKSTLLNLIGGLDSVDSGRIIVDQEEISQLRKKGLLEYRRSKLSYIFQFYNLIPNLNVKENIRVCQYLSDNPLKLEELMIFLGIEDQQFKFPSQLSGGQQQRVAIARALVKNPQLLLCDEPTGALDSVNALETLKLLQQVNQDYETTILLVTHNEEIAKMADNIIRVKDGKVVEMIENKHKQDASLLVV